MNGLWVCTGGRAVTPAPFCVCGILNVTPDSFSDGCGLVPSVGEAVAAARRMAAAFASYGCGMLDLGAESTRPGASPVGGAEERARLLPVLSAVLDALPEVPVSVDTVRAGTAAAALGIGAHAVNDVSGCADPAMAEVLASFRPGYVLTHPEAYGGPDRTLRWFESRLAGLTAAGLPEDRVVLDPGVGFGKTAEESIAAIRHVAGLSRLGRPVYLGASRKSFLGGLFGIPLGMRDAPTAIVAFWAACRGVAYHRVHNVEETIPALRLAAALGQEEDRWKGIFSAPTGCEAGSTPIR